MSHDTPTIRLRWERTRMVVAMYGISSMGHRIARAIQHKTGCPRILIANTLLAVDGSNQKGPLMRINTGEALRRGWEQGNLPCKHPELVNEQDEIDKDTGKRLCTACGEYVADRGGTEART